MTRVTSHQGLLRRKPLQHRNWLPVITPTCLYSPKLNISQTRKTGDCITSRDIEDGIARQKIVRDTLQLPPRLLLEQVEQLSQLPTSNHILIRPIWSAVVGRIFELCSQPEDVSQFQETHAFYKSIPAYLRACPKLPARPSVDSRTAVYLLCLLSKVPRLPDSPKTLAYLLSSIRSTDRLTVTETIPLIQAVTRFMFQIRSYDIPTPDPSQLYEDESVTVPTALIEQRNTRPDMERVRLIDVVTATLTRTVNGCVTNASPEQLVNLTRELGAIPLHVKNVVDLLRRVVTTNAKELETDVLIESLESVLKFGITDKDVNMYVHVAEEVMYNRVKYDATPPQLTRLLVAFGTAKICYPYLINPSIKSLMRFTAEEWQDINRFTNRMRGLIPREEDGRWSSSCINAHRTSHESSSDSPRIGDQSSKLFVGKDFARECRADAESAAARLYIRVIAEQLTMTPDDTLCQYKDKSLASLCYPLLATDQFAPDPPKPRYQQDSIVNRVLSTLIETPVTIKPTIARLIPQLLGALNAVRTHDELLILPLSFLFSFRDFDRVKKKSSQTRLVWRTGRSMLQQWSKQELLDVVQAFFTSRVYIPPAAVLNLSQEVLKFLPSLDGREFGRFVQSSFLMPRGLTPDLFSYDNKRRLRILEDVSTSTIWMMDIIQLSCLLMNCVVNCHLGQRDKDSSLESWTCGPRFTTLLESLAVKLHMGVRMHNATACEDLYLVSDRLSPPSAQRQQCRRMSHNSRQLKIARHETETSPAPSPQISANSVVKPQIVPSNRSSNDTIQLCSPQQSQHNMLRNYIDQMRQELELQQTLVQDDDDIDVVIIGSPNNPNELEHTEPWDTRKGGYTRTEREITDETPDATMLNSAAFEQSVPVVWTALLSCLMLDDVGTESEILSWDKRLTKKLDYLPTNTLALIVDLLSLCGAAAAAAEDVENKKDLERSEDNFSAMLLRQLSNIKSGPDDVPTAHSSRAATGMTRSVRACLDHLNKKLHKSLQCSRDMVSGGYREAAVVRADIPVGPLTVDLWIRREQHNEAAEREVELRLRSTRIKPLPCRDAILDGYMQLANQLEEEAADGHQDEKAYNVEELEHEDD